MMAALLTLLILAQFASARTYDYVVVGGGTAGLTVAARLSEDPKKSVLVLEAGEDRSSDIDVLAPGLLTSLYSNPKYDWNFHTVPQPHANDHVIAHPCGKQLGGSSAINFLWWTHASQQDVNNWGHLGNKNWSWDALEPFFRRSEAYLKPSKEVQEALQTSYIDEGLHGSWGPILTTFADIYGELDEAWPRTYEELGLDVKEDPKDGLALGGYTNLLNMDLKTRSRSYAATTYLRDAETRPNLEVITGAHVERILFDTGSSTPKATGVAFEKADEKHMISARKEIILSAGAFGSPQILELSGIGDPRVLERYGIKTIVENTNVGENLQDHAYVSIGYQVRPGIFTLDDFANETLFNEALEQYVSNRTGLLATTSAMSALLSLRQIEGLEHPTLKQAIVETCHSKEAIHEQRSAPSLEHTASRQHTITSPQRLQLELICNDIEKGEAIVQEFAFPAGLSPQLSNDTSRLFLANTAGNFFTINGVLEHPLSRGSVHISSSDPQAYPRIDPNYLSHPLDLKMLEVITLHLQQVVQTPPLSNLLVDNGTAFQPGYHQLDEANVSAWIRDNLQSEYHPCGTCAMLSKNDGGVVDGKFRVYGVEGLRVVDASVFPLIPRANIQSLVYAVAERAAEFIREDWSQ